MYTIFNPEDISISHIACDDNSCEIMQGENREVKITINSEELSGPGRLKLDLSKTSGINLSEIENDGSSFTFKNNEGLFIWYDLPKNKKIEITYLLTSDSNALGLQKITGSFSYISNNDRKQFEIDTLTINIIEGDKLKNQPSVKADRTIDGENGVYIVKIHTVKGKHKGFARIKDELPVNFIASPIESAGAIFKNIDGSAKFIWSDLPSSIESFTVSYKLINPKNIDTTFMIKGVYASEKLINEGYNSGIPIPATFYSPDTDEFSYNKLENDTISDMMNEVSEVMDTNKKVIDTLLKKENIIEFNLEELSEITKKDSLIEDDTLITESISENETPDEITEEIIEDNFEDQTLASIPQESIITFKTTKTNVNYKVQILAAHRIAQKKYLNSEFNFSDNYDLENHNGWIKYTTGNFNEYEGARNKRNSLKKHEFPGPFVTAYNYGERITVQEALIISKQSWIP